MYICLPAHNGYQEVTRSSFYYAPVPEDLLIGSVTSVSDGISRVSIAHLLHGVVIAIIIHLHIRRKTYIGFLT